MNNSTALRVKKIMAMERLSHIFSYKYFVQGTNT